MAERQRSPEGEKTGVEAVAMSTPPSPGTDDDAETKFIPWEVFYMSVAALEAQRSNCTESTDKVSIVIAHLMYICTGFGH